MRSIIYRRLDLSKGRVIEKCSEASWVIKLILDHWFGPERDLIVNGL